MNINDDNQQLKSEIIEQAHVWYALGCDYFKLTPKPLNIVFKKRGTTAGTAWTSRNEIDFNIIIARDNKEAFFKRTIGHEVAHLIADAFYKKRCGHGIGWKKVMGVFGISAERCHKYNTENAKVRHHEKFLYCCGCGINFHEVGKNVHEKIQSGRKYSCRICKQPLKKK